MGFPIFSISLDFELRWGMYDRLGANLDAYRENLMNARGAVLALLKLLVARKMPATWACVGALACRDWNDYFSRAPQPPKYERASLRFSPRFSELDPRGDLHFAPDLLDAIHAAPGQELGTHTFSHLLMREPGVTAGDVRSDLIAVAKLWEERFGSPPRSLSFPRNQWAFLEVVRGSSIRIWRGNPAPWYYECNEAATNRALPRALRLLDSLNPRARRSTGLEGDMTRGSLFLRVHLPPALWSLHVARIRNEVEALRPGQIFHLWWHPHNLGRDTAARLRRVEEVLDFVAARVDRGLLALRSMGELAEGPLSPTAA